jgi:uncharacterized protein (TIGR03084 family)
MQGDLLPSLVQDLEAEYDVLDDFVAALSPADWDRDTPAVGFNIRDQIHHLALGEELAALAATDPDGFAARRAALLADPGIRRAASAQAKETAPAALLAAWRRERAATLDALGHHRGPDRLPWVAGDMSAASFATARLMETWAHGQDVFDAFGQTRSATPRLRHIAQLGVSTRRFSYRNRGLEVPTQEVRVELQGPQDDSWVWGPPDTADSVRGPAEDFCLVVTQRRHVDDTRLDIDGPLAGEWMSIAQAFAGPPTAVRPAGQFRPTA